MRGRHRGVEVLASRIEDGSFQVPRYIDEMTREMKGGYRGLLRAANYVDFMADVEQMQADEDDAVVADSEGEQFEDMTPEGAAFLEALAAKRKEQQATPEVMNQGGEPQLLWVMDQCGGRPVPTRPEIAETLVNPYGLDANMLQSDETEPSQPATRQKDRRASALKQPEAHARVLQQVATSSAGTAVAAGQRPLSRPLAFEDDFPEYLRPGGAWRSQTPPRVTAMLGGAGTCLLEPECLPLLTAMPMRSPSTNVDDMEYYRRLGASSSACRPRAAFSPAHSDLQRESQRQLSPRGPPDGLRISTAILPMQSRLAQIIENRSPSPQSGRDSVGANTPGRAASPTAGNEDFWSLRDTDRPLTPSSVTRPDAPIVQMSNSEVGFTTAQSGGLDDTWNMNSPTDFNRQVSPPPSQQNPPPDSVRAFLKRRDSYSLSSSCQNELIALSESPLAPGERPRRKSLGSIPYVISTQDAQAFCLADTSPKYLQSTVMPKADEEGEEKEDDDEKEKAFPGAEELGREAEKLSLKGEEQLHVVAAQCGAQDGRPMIHLQTPSVPDGSSNVEQRRFPSHDPLDVCDDISASGGNNNSSSCISYPQEESTQKSQQSEGWVDYDYKVVGAGGVGDVTNGFYRQVNIFNDMPKYKLLGGDAIIYYFGCWKINYRDDTDGWYYSHPDELSSTPPDGMWSTHGYSGGDADPAPSVHMNREPYESLFQAAVQHRTQSERPIPTPDTDEQENSLLLQGYSWSGKPSAADPGHVQEFLQGSRRLIGEERLVNSSEVSRMDEDEEEEEDRLLQLQQEGSVDRSKDRRNQRLQLQTHGSKQDTLDWYQHRDLAFISPKYDGEEECSLQECKLESHLERPHSQQEVREPLNAWLMRNQIQEINRDLTGSPLFIGGRSFCSPLEDLDAPLAQVLGALGRAPAIKDVRRPLSAGRWNRACTTPSPDIRMSPLPTLSPRGCSTTTTPKNGLMVVASSQKVQRPQQASTHTGRRPSPSTQPLDGRQRPRKALGTSLLSMMPPSRVSTRSRTSAQTQKLQALKRLQQPCHEKRKAQALQQLGQRPTLVPDSREEPKNDLGQRPALVLDSREEVKNDSTLSHSSGSEPVYGLDNISHSSHMYWPSD